MSKKPSRSLTLTAEGIRSSVLRELADERIAEAQLLLAHKRWTGAAYLVGYGVELHLKAVIAVRRWAGVWPLPAIAQEYMHHNLEILLDQAGLRITMRQAAKNNSDLGINWQAVRGWGPHRRYSRLHRRRASEPGFPMYLGLQLTSRADSAIGLRS